MKTKIQTGRWSIRGGFKILPMLLLMLVPLQNSSATEGNFYGAKTAEKPDWFKESFLEFEEDVAEAAAAGRRVMLYFHQDGCPYCARLVEENFTDSETKAFIVENFDGITLNMWGDRPVVSVAGQDFTEKTFAAAMRVQYTPTLIFLDEQGKVALRLNGYYPPQDFRAALDYVAGRLEHKLSFSQYRLDAMPPSGEKLIEEDFYLDQTDLDKIITSGRQLLALINDILDLSKIETGNMSLHCEFFMPGETLSQTCDSIGPLLRQNQNALHTSGFEDLPKFYNDATKFRQIITNLLSNAGKFTKGGEIEASARILPEAPHWLEITVRDTGIGMNEDQQSRIFDAFVQADSSTSANYGGTGLGLAIVRQILDMHDARLSISSEEGRGSIFSCKFSSPQTVKELSHRAMAEQTS